MILRYVLACVLGYLIGCFSTGLLVAKNSGHDIRSEGSKNTGATNVLRVLGVKKGLLTFAGDFVKATCAMLIGAWLLGKNGALLGGFAAVIGHNWPVFYGFKGGKGVACTIALMFLFLWQGLIAGALAILVVWRTKYVSLASITLTTSFAILLLITESFFPAGVWAIALALLCVWRHRTNIQRLLNGTENKFGAKKQA